MPVEVLKCREVRQIGPFVHECFITVSPFRKSSEILERLLVAQSSHVRVAVRVNMLRRFQDYVHFHKEDICIFSRSKFHLH